MEEDCKVVISPWLQVRDAAGATINTTTKSQYEYFETEDLNTLVKGADEWSQLFTGDYVDGNPNPADPDERGVKIHNAVTALMPVCEKIQMQSRLSKFQLLMMVFP